MKPKFKVRWAFAGAALFSIFLIAVILCEGNFYPDPFFGSEITQLTIIALVILSTPAAIAGFIAGGMAGGFWREDFESKSGGVRFQFSLLTSTVSLIAAGFFAGLSFLPHSVVGPTNKIEYGWPAPFIFYGKLEGWSCLYRFDNGGVRISSIAVDFLCVMFLLIVIAFVTERLSTSDIPKADDGTNGLPTTKDQKHPHENK
ncbi:MAG: hypothetical protein HY291_12865 [Planctomycetes bacterium]|nr:hypothetical protein [Planctomycetota bacterium]